MPTPLTDEEPLPPLAVVEGVRAGGDQALKMSATFPGLLKRRPEKLRI
jgi:hypothetical protein